MYVIERDSKCKRKVNQYLIKVEPVTTVTTIKYSFDYLTNQFIGLAETKGKKVDSFECKILIIGDLFYI